MPSTRVDPTIDGPFPVSSSSSSPSSDFQISRKNRLSNPARETRRQYVIADNELIICAANNNTMSSAKHIVRCPSVRPSGRNCISLNHCNQIAGWKFHRAHQSRSAGPQKTKTKKPKKKRQHSPCNKTASCDIMRRKAMAVLTSQTRLYERA